MGRVSRASDAATTMNQYTDILPACLNGSILSNDQQLANLPGRTQMGQCRETQLHCTVRLPRQFFVAAALTRQERDRAFERDSVANEAHTLLGVVRAVGDQLG